eukprot:5607200-Pleurochrysis_carterae.AAC.1
MHAAEFERDESADQQLLPRQPGQPRVPSSHVRAHDLEAHLCPLQMPSIGQRHRREHAAAVQ